MVVLSKIFKLLKVFTLQTTTLLVCKCCLQKLPTFLQTLVLISIFSEYWLRYVSLVVLVLQNTGQVLLMRYATRREQTQFLKTVAVFWNEVFKLVAATILFIVSTGSLKE